MEHEMCNYLNWELMVDNPILSDFEQMVKKDFSMDGTHPTYALHLVSKRALRAEESKSNMPMLDPCQSSSPILAFGPNHPSPIKTSMSPVRSKSSPNPPMTPDTPSPSYSTSTSPASSASPATPMSVDEMNPKIQTFESPRFSMMVPKVDPVYAIHPLKPKMFAYVQPARW